MENILAIPTSLFRSKLRQRLLALFLTNPQDRYYTRQLHQILGGSVGSLQRELIYLENLGILKSEKVGNLKFYQANPDYPMLQEITGITAKTVGIYGSLTTALRAINGIRLAFVYGSFAAGQETARSDIDLFIVGDFDHGTLNRSLSDVEKTLQREVNYTAMSTDEFREAVRDSNAFVLNVAEAAKVWLIGGENELKSLD